MKKLVFAFMMLAASFAVVSCNTKEEDSNPIVGTWVCNDPVIYANGDIRDYTETYVFKSDGTMSIQFICQDMWDDHWTFGIRLGGTYTVDATKFSFKAHMVATYEENGGKVEWRENENEGETRDCTFEYKIEGKKMTVYYGRTSAIFGHGGSEVMVYDKQ
jgi:hypothetical protein